MKTFAFAAAAIAIAFAPGCKKKEENKKPAKPAPTKPAADKPAPDKPTKSAIRVKVGKTLEAKLEARSGSKVAGTVTFREVSGKVLVTANMTGLTPGDHGFHIHEKGDCSAPDAKSAGGHFNPMKVDHGGPASAKQHAGDLGNITADDKGNATKSITWPHVTLGAGDTNIEGRAVVVHAKADDLKSQPSGAAGARVACGVIKAKDAAAAAPADKAAAPADDKAAPADKKAAPATK